jgi:exonuclease 3'-5' domain-containing protein 1
MFEELIHDVHVLAVDCKGIDISRVGPLTLMSIGVRVPGGVHVFVFDFLHSFIQYKTSQLFVLKRLLENPMVVKVIHDCRHISDALKTQHRVTLTNVFDSSVYVMKMGENTHKRKVLHSALKEYSCVHHARRDNIFSMYKITPEMWISRPLTTFMIEYASKDVGCLFDLRDKLLDKMARESREGEETKASDEKFADIYLANAQAVSDFRGMGFHCFVNVPKVKVPSVVGLNGAGTDIIEQVTGGHLAPSACGFLCLAESQAKLDQMKRLIKASYN